MVFCGVFNDLDQRSGVQHLNLVKIHNKIQTAQHHHAKYLTVIIVLSNRY